MSNFCGRLTGSLTALVTPFRDGAVDEAALVRLTERQIAAGTTGLVACGSTGEAPALTEAEHARVVSVVVAASAGRVPVIAGVGAPNTEQACQLAKNAAASGADALLCAPPAYIKPTQTGIIAHFSAVARASALPLVLYDIPGRCAVGLTDETILRMAETGCVVALKDASGDLSRPVRLKARLGNLITQLSGDDATVSGYLAMGGDGCISVTANVAPEHCALLHRAWQTGDFETFKTQTRLLAPLNHALFLESNPIPVKAALEWLALIRGEVRLPLTEAESLTVRELQRCITELNGADRVGHILPNQLASVYLAH
jgi:4-hydroxy-tetrahydrodipicolinate synthase